MAISYLEVSARIIFFGSGLSFLMGLGQLTGKRRVRLDYIVFALLVCLSVFLLNLFFFAIDVPFHCPAATFLFFTSIYLFGPLLYIYFYSLLYPNKPIYDKAGRHLMPAACVFILEIIFQLQSIEYKRFFFGSIHDGNHSEVVLIFVLSVGAVHAISYMVYSLKEAFSIWDSGDLKEEIIFVALIIGGGVIGLILCFVGSRLHLTRLFLASSVMISLIPVVVFLAQRRYPQISRLLIREIKTRRYKKNLLTGLNTDHIHDRIMELMNEEKVYQDMDLSIDTLADKLCISANQLSQFLNEIMGMDFRNFINTYRVEEAKRLLTEKPQESVISICFEVGFGSKSTFNATFKKYTGFSPSEFRKKNMRNDS